MDHRNQSRIKPHDGLKGREIEKSPALHARLGLQLPQVLWTFVSGREVAEFKHLVAEGKAAKEVSQIVKVDKLGVCRTVENK